MDPAKSLKKLEEQNSKKVRMPMEPELETILLSKEEKERLEQ